MRNNFKPWVFENKFIYKYQNRFKTKSTILVGLTDPKDTPHKFEAFEKFKEFRAEVEKQLDTYIKSIRSDRGDEYLSNEFIDHLVQNGILSQLTAHGTPQ